jgi:hypothetical protein
MVDGMNAEKRSFTEPVKSTIWPGQPTFNLEIRKAAPSAQRSLVLAAANRRFESEAERSQIQFDFSSGACFRPDQLRQSPP